MVKPALDPLRDGAFAIMDHLRTDQDLDRPDPLSLQQHFANEYPDGITRFAGREPQNVGEVLAPAWQ